MARKLWSLGKLFLLLAGIFVIIYSDFQGQKHKLRLLPTQAELEAVLTGANLKDRKAYPIPHYPGGIEENGKKLKAVAVLTAELEPEIKGFTDQINILFSIDETGRIIALIPISHRESKHYFRLIERAGFFQKIKGKRYTELDDIKAVSGATISSRAILQDIKTSAQLVMEKIFGAEGEVVSKPGWIDLYFQPKIIILCLMLFFGLILRLGRLPGWTRWLGFGLSIGIIGVWLKTPLSLPHFFQILALKINFSSNPYLVVMIGFAFFSTLFFGPVWCGYLCPYAGLQEFAGRLGRKVRWHPSLRIQKIFREIRWVILFSLVLLYFIGGKSEASEVEPFFFLFSRSWSVIPLSLIVFTLLASFFLPRFWCRFFCPTGAILLLLSSHRKIFKMIEKGVKESQIDPEAEGKKESKSNPEVSSQS